MGPIVALAENALRLCMDMGERLQSIENLLNCPNGHTNAEIIEKIRELVRVPPGMAERLHEIALNAAVLAGQAKLPPGQLALDLDEF